MKRHNPKLLILLIVVLLIGFGGIAVVTLWPDEKPPVRRTSEDSTEIRTPTNEAAALGAASPVEPDIAPEEDRPEPDAAAPEKAQEDQPEAPDEPAGPAAHGYPEPEVVKSDSRAREGGPEVLMFGKVIDERDVPVPDANVVMYATRHGEGDDGGFSGRILGVTDHLGKFSLKALNVQFSGTTYQYAVTASKEGYTQGTILTPDPRAPMTLRLKQFSDRTTIEGEVLDESGMPVAAARVWCRATMPVFDPESFGRLPGNMQEALESAASIAWMADARTNEYGRFTLAAKRPGKTKVWAGPGDPEAAGNECEIETVDGAVNPLPRPLTLKGD